MAFVWRLELLTTGYFEYYYNIDIEKFLAKKQSIVATLYALHRILVEEDVFINEKFKKISWILVNPK